MSFNFTLTEFENLNLYNNRSMENVVASLVNKSSNACLVSMFEDSIILLDHTDGIFYIADYKFDRENLTLTVENFEAVELIREDDSFKNNVHRFFEDEDEADVSEIVESYKSDVVSQEKFITELINESMSKKDFDNLPDYDEIREAVKDTELESKNEKFFQKYKERIQTHPLTEIKHFNWENTVIVSLVETENQKLVNKTSIQRANDLWKKVEFKESFIDACDIFIEDVEEGTDMLKDILEEYPQIFFLDKADRNSMFGKAIISSSSLREDMEDILEGINILFDKFDLADLREEYLSEAEEAGVEPDATGEEDTETPEEKPEEVDPGDKKKLIDDLKKVAEKIENEGAKKKLDDIIEKMEKGLEEGTRPTLVKEAVSLLSL